VFFDKKYKECLEKAKNDFLFRKNAFEACFQTSAFLFALLEHQSSPVERRKMDFSLKLETTGEESLESTKG
jgi:hypothetical protein